MLETPWSPALLFVLRHALFLGPLALALMLMHRASANRRMLVGALFSLLYALALVFVGHVVAIRVGWWSYGSEALKLLGFPADIWFGGALLWGPVLFLLFPLLSPWFLVLPFVALNGLVLPALAPFVMAGKGWFAGVVLVFLTAHLPALYLAHWTMKDVRLPSRALLLAIGYGCFAFIVTPSVIMHAMGGEWSALTQWPTGVLMLTGLAMLVRGLSAVQMFALHGEGTPIPLDPTKRLVRTGLYAYVANPMQLSTALAWSILGAALGNVSVALAAVMAVCFVLGLVRWHQRQDLAVRFPVGWPEYRAHVPEWLPRWRPWIRNPAQLQYDPGVHWQRTLVSALERLGARGLNINDSGARLSYREPDETRDFAGLAAAGKALNHINFATALLDAGVLLIILPLGAAARAVAPRACAQERRRA
jgi:protein-S-isoprenylcysteine O-methyltransferase Ste14